MRKLHIMILRAYMGPFIVTSLVVLFIFLMQFIWKYLDDFMGKGLEWYVLVELLFYATASFVPPALPIGILLSSIMTMGNLGENTELTPMRSAGLSLFRIVKPMFALIVLISGASFLFSNNIMPVANLKFKSLLYDVVNKKPALNIQPGVFYNGIDGFSIRASQKDAEKGRLEDILIYDHRESIRGNRTVVRAEWAELRKSADESQLVITLHNGRSYDERSPGATKKDNSKWPLVYNTFEKDQIRFDLATFGMDKTDDDLFKQHYQMMTLGQLQSNLDSLAIKKQGREAQRRQYLRHGLYITRDSVLTKLDQGQFTPKEDFIKKLDANHTANLHDIAMNMSRNAVNFIDRQEEEMKSRDEHMNKFNVEWHRKLTLAFACIVMFFIGAPLGAVIRKGGMGLPVVIALIFFVIFHLLSFSGERLIKSGNWAAWQGMWMPTFVLAPLSIFLTYKAAVDSPIFNKEAYYRILQKLKRKKD